jgi:GH24 family phage-related lysozyme (muramidase)
MRNYLITFLALFSPYLGLSSPGKTCQDKTAEFIAEFEGFSGTAYWDSTRWSIGYGTKAKGPNTSISREKARKKLSEKVNKILDHIQNIRPTATCGQLLAMTSLAYNIGIPRWNRNFLRDWEAERDRQIMKNIPKFRKAGGEILRGLELRRLAELEAYKNLK